ncbi:hypothetical protein E3N88_06122 [Mikania micrantha]|uniref:Uncharacterized protein n=1 Tax=Mikania micrantha TaxID=192012 RepID=A0A5N6PP01_9ASTR|nr:hypothetical protein E3N88_06122 [Mikania micrantha]
MENIKQRVRVLPSLTEDKAERRSALFQWLELQRSEAVERLSSSSSFFSMFVFTRKCRRELGFRSFDDQNVWLNRRRCSSSSHHRSRKWGFRLDCMDSDGHEEDDEQSSKLEKRVLGFSGWTGVEERTLYLMILNFERVLQANLV